MPGARQLKVAFCLFCGEAPCVCNKPAKPKTNSTNRSRSTKDAAKAADSPPKETQPSAPRIAAPPIVRPAIPVGQGFTATPVKEPPQIPSRAANQPVSQAKPVPNSWAWHEDPPKPTFAQAQEMEHDWHTITAISVLVDHRLVSGEETPGASEWRENRRSRLVSGGDDSSS